MDELLSSVDQPLKVMNCPETNKEFILCDYNRDGDSYRSCLSPSVSTSCTIYRDSLLFHPPSIFH